jgi:hypothetical protein
MGNFMVSNWAMIQNNLVENIVVWDGDENTWQPPEGYLMEPIPEGMNVGIGWGWDGTNFVQPISERPLIDQPGTAPDVIQ